VSEFAEVVLNLPVDRSFTYRVPPALRDIVRPGVRVKVPFGPREQHGYVVKLADTASFPRIKDLKEASEEVPEGVADITSIDVNAYAVLVNHAIYYDPGFERLPTVRIDLETGEVSTFSCLAAFWGAAFC
jgi:primosomal protein N'